MSSSLPTEPSNTPLAADTIVSVRNVSKSVEQADGTLHILRDISFDLERGSVTAIVGASGSGKSSLLAIMAGLDVPTSGTVLVDGADLFALDEDGRAALRGQTMGFVFQNFQLMPNLTALENVMLPLELAGRADARDAARAMLERVGLGERLNAYPRVLSGGEQQRVALARAFVQRPKLLLADEPTGSLDAATGERILQLLFALNREQGTTLVLVTHDAGLAQGCQQQLVIVNGRVVGLHP
ncbi:ABC transporter ATP-binding protein [Brachymonas denitrificans]|uniref:Putative ABC transport system ATP-binding protein n=1 Tax=Brachymonas denitrificans DSM 15123 TaxID=1121117 RepID=A0A1H8FJL6_9BURK|nr:ATP-binding cassette domain-containing protein [Brachymonas denitrificans]SEN31704.1 putative ABC transport system ATP-binding protein [Brachymonas denitrificans DSM 15123]